MTDRGHPTPAELRDLAGRTLEALDEDRALTEHLTQCDECLELYDALWREASTDLADLDAVFPDSVAVGRLEYELFRRIHVASLATASSWLVTEGFLRVILGVLLPIVELERTPSRRAGGERP